LIRRGFKKQQEQKKFFRVNERIFASSLRVINAEGKQIGILSKNEALEKAKSEGLDLVEIAPHAKPPVAKIINFKKFLYQEAKRKQEEKRKTKVSETKEVRLGPFMNQHDLEIMTIRARGFLEDSDKVRLVVKFNGRQIAHPEFGREVINKVTSALANISKIEKEPKFEGRQLITILSPERKQLHAKEKNQELSQKAI